MIVLPTYNERDNIEPFLRAAAIGQPDARGAGGRRQQPRRHRRPRSRARRASSAASRCCSATPRRAWAAPTGPASTRCSVPTDGEAYDVVVSMDADLSHDPARDAQRMLALIDDGADAVIGSRYVRGGGTTDWPVRRQLLSKWGNAYTRRLLRLAPHDCTSGYRAYRASALAAIEPQSTRRPRATPSSPSSCGGSPGTATGSSRRRSCSATAPTASRRCRGGSSSSRCCS